MIGALAGCTTVGHSQLGFVGYMVCCFLVESIVLGSDLPTVNWKAKKVRVGGSTSQTDLGISQGDVLIVTLFLVVINGILGELENGVDGSFFADEIAIYITTRNKKVAARALQGNTNKLDAWAVEKSLTFSTNKTVNMVYRTNVLLSLSL